jgi:hypothetical protein
MTPLAFTPIPPPLPGLNTRETAVVVWLGVALLFVLTKGDVRRSIGGLFRLIVTSAWIAGALLVAAAWATASILLLNFLGYWEPTMTKVAVVWFLGLGLVALFNTKDVDDFYFYRLLRRNLELAVVVEFIVALHTFPLPVELIFVPLAFMLVGSQVVAEGNAEFAPARKLIAWCLGLLGVASLSFSLVYVGEHFGEVVTAERIKEFLLPLVLTACFVPFLVGVRYVSVWQSMLTMVRFGLHENDDLYRFARRSIIRACGANLLKAQLFASNFRGRLWGATSEAEVTRVVDDFRQTWSRAERRAA